MNLATTVERDLELAAEFCFELAKYAQTAPVQQDNGSIRGRIEPLGILGTFLLHTDPTKLRGNHQIVDPLLQLSELTKDLSSGQGPTEYQDPVNGLCMQSSCRNIAEVFKRLAEEAKK